jgi:hypothetical protein
MVEIRARQLKGAVADAKTRAHRALMAHSGQVETQRLKTFMRYGFVAQLRGFFKLPCSYGKLIGVIDIFHKRNSWR